MLSDVWRQLVLSDPDPLCPLWTHTGPCPPATERHPSVCPTLQSGPPVPLQDTCCVRPLTRTTPTSHAILLTSLANYFLRTQPALECEANESVHWRKFGPNSPSSQQIYIHSRYCSLGIFGYLNVNELWISTNHLGLKGLTLHFLVTVVNTLNTKTRSSKEIAEFSFKNANVKSICYCKQRTKCKLSLS